MSLRIATFNLENLDDRPGLQPSLAVRGAEIHNEVLPHESGAFRQDTKFPESDHARWWPSSVLIEPLPPNLNFPSQPESPCLNRKSGEWGCYTDEASLNSYLSEPLPGVAAFFWGLVSNPETA
jgi:hypothetical protein